MTVTLRMQDAREALRAIPDESVDLIVTDPPYRVISGGITGANRPTGMLSANNGRIMEHNDTPLEDYAADLYRVLRDGSHCYVMTNLLNLWTFRDVLESVGFKLHNLLVWKKQNVIPNRWYMKNCEFVLFMWKGHVKTINLRGSTSCHEFRNPVGKKSHPTEKPVDLMQFYIENSSEPGQVVLDPFMGSGATGVAAVGLDRRFIGFEIDPVYFNRACARMGRMPG